jgi:hypothetical protein
MSQFYQGVVSGSLPPVVPTSFVTDSGTVVPAANVVNINGSSTSSNNVNGIQVIANPAGSNNELVQLTNRIQGSVTTANNTVTTIITFVLPATGTYSFDINIAAYNTTDTSGASYSLFVGFKSVGGVASKLNLEDKIVNEEASMILCNTSVTFSGNSVLVQVTGLVGKSIDWNAVGTYTYVG